MMFEWCSIGSCLVAFVELVAVRISHQIDASVVPRTKIHSSFAGVDKPFDSRGLIRRRRALYVMHAR